MNVVFDASALLAVLFKETGADIVMEAVPGSFISSVNWAEVAQKLLAKSIEPAPIRVELEAAGLVISPFSMDDGDATARLWRRGSGLSLADRACIALGIRLGLPVWTTDRSFANFSSSADITVIRQ